MLIKERLKTKTKCIFIIICFTITYKCPFKDPINSVSCNFIPHTQKNSLFELNFTVSRIGGKIFGSQKYL